LTSPARASRPANFRRRASHLAGLSTGAIVTPRARGPPAARQFSAFLPWKEPARLGKPSRPPLRADIPSARDLTYDEYSNLP
jgi:hypothetical protein